MLTIIKNVNPDVISVEVEREWKITNGSNPFISKSAIFLISSFIFLANTMPRIIIKYIGIVFIRIEIINSIMLYLYIMGDGSTGLL
jgi:hypothetical protein